MTKHETERILTAVAALHWVGCQVRIGASKEYGVHVVTARGDGELLTDFAEANRWLLARAK